MLATQPRYVVRDDGREEDRSFLALRLALLANGQASSYLTSFFQSRRWFELITCTEILLHSLTPLTTTTEQMVCGTHGQR